MVEKVEALVSRLTKQEQSTLEFFAELPKEHWHAKIYSEGASWRIRDILAHFVSSEDAIRRLVEHIVAGGEGVPSDFDLDAYNEKHVSSLDGESPDELLDRFSRNRQKTIRFVRQLTDSDVEKVGRHPWLGMAPVSDMIKLMYRHNQIHQRDIRKALAILEQD